MILEIFFLTGKDTLSFIERSFFIKGQARPLRIKMHVSLVALPMSSCTFSENVNQAKAIRNYYNNSRQFLKHNPTDLFI